MYIYMHINILIYSQVCHSSAYAYWLTRTFLESFGEFFLPEDGMLDLTALIPIVTFFVCNIVLLNLLFAMMASTYASLQVVATVFIYF